MSELTSERTLIRPRIVITTPDPARSKNPELSRQKLALYVEAVERHGGIAVPVDSASSDEERQGLFDEMAALFLTGGADIDPSFYHEEPDGSDDVDAARDRLELAAWRAAEERGLPVLGICRGLQAINVFAGGSLIQDVPDHAGTPYGQGLAQTHNMVIDPDSRLARAIAEAAPEGLAATDEADTSIELLVNTYHHQAIDHARLAPGLRAVGWAASSSHGRLVEAAESRDGRWIVGVQCHPERTESTPQEFEGLFDAFVRAAREAAAEPVG
jgi:putative glutamine amidotransferase